VAAFPALADAMKKYDFDYLDGLLSGLDDLNDGAWQAVCESSSATDPRFKGRDPFDVWMAWCIHTSEKQAHDAKAKAGNKR